MRLHCNKPFGCCSPLARNASVTDRTQNLSVNHFTGSTSRPIADLGGDPAAGSPTATLLRLLPPRRPQIRRGRIDSASSVTSSGGATGGVCKERGRVHRAMLTRGYWGFQVHEGEFQPSIPTTVKFRGLPPPSGFGTHCLHHCSPRAAQVIRGMLTCRCPLLPPP